MPDAGELFGAVSGACDAGPPSIACDIRGPHVVVIGNHKGGTGKSTVAMHIVIALLKAGKSVATFDLDLEQQTLTRYIRNRHDFARQRGLTLELPTHVPIVEPDWTGADDGDA